MINPATLKGQLSSLPTRANRKASAEAWGTGDIGVPEHLLPDVTEAAREALTRIAQTAKSIGTRVVESKKTGVLGDVNWGGKKSSMDRLLREQDLEATADELLEQALYSGIIAGIVRRDPSTNQARIEPIVGHVEPIYGADSPTLITGVLHAWTTRSNGAAKWTVRVYDLQERTMREWRDLTDTQRIARGDQAPDAVIEPSAEFPAGAPMPRIQMIGRDSGRMPKGELAKLLPLLWADWSSQVRGSRIEESTAIPQLVVKGEVEDGTNERSPTHVVRVLEDGDAKYIVPGDMSTLHEQHNRILERIREDGNLPGGFLGSQTPSGVALQEANAKFISANRRYAIRLSRALTELVADLADAEGIADPPQVTVTINREFTRSQDIDDTIKLFRDDLVDHGAAVRHVTPFIPTWEDDQVEAFIASRAEAVPVEPTSAGGAEETL